MNHVILVGRLVRIPEMRKTETGKNVTNITLAVSRSFKDSNGEYSTDFIDCTLWEAVAQRVIKYCKQGDLLGIKGRIQVLKEGSDEIKFNVLNVIAENIRMLSHPQTKLDNDEDEMEGDNNKDEEKNSKQSKK